LGADVFVGDVANVDWSATREGISVSAWIGSVEMAHTQVSNGSYNLGVTICSDSRDFNSMERGAIIKFSIDGFWAEQTAILDMHTAKELNLHQTNDPVVIN